jgi:quercetin dioxygenase-like cupin family protein
MPFIVRTDERITEEIAPGISRAWILAPDRLPDGRLSVEVLSMRAGTDVDVITADRELAWLQVLTGETLIAADGMDPQPTDHFIVTMLARQSRARITAVSDATVLVCRAPHAQDYDAHLAPHAMRRVDWSTEPVLNSEHDTRQRIYLASTGLWGTEAVKGEMIIYPPGASGAAHHHEGAEHFQFMISGSGTAVLAGEEVHLHTGDFLYNLENELHSFYNGTSTDMVFVEFFVPGESRTVWPPEVNVCGWQPTGTDIKGRAAARHLSYHVHGEGDV